MLAVFYCGEENCGHIHIRSDERSCGEHAICPKCSKRMMFICDFITWFKSDEIQRTRLLMGRNIVLYRRVDQSKNRRIIREHQIENIDKYRIIKEIQEKYTFLKEENIRLKIEEEESGRILSHWKNRGIIYHDELWKILNYYEPEKYHR